MQNFSFGRFLIPLTVRFFEAVWLIQWNSTCHFTFVNSRLHLLNLKITAINAASTQEQMLFNQQLSLPTLIKAVQSRAWLAAALLFFYLCYKNISNLPVTMTAALLFFKKKKLANGWLALIRKKKCSFKNTRHQRPGRSERGLEKRAAHKVTQRTYSYSP